MNFNYASDHEGEEMKMMIRNFLDKLEQVDVWFYVFQLDNIHHCPYLSRSFSHKFECYNNMPKPIEGIDLGHVKHFSDDCLVVMTNHFSDKNFIRKSPCGQQFRGKVIGSTQEVLVKRWDLSVRFNGFSRYHLYPSLFSYQIEFLLNPCVASHPHMAKLIGFSCDKTFALVFDLKVDRTLKDLIPLDSFLWIQRMKSQVACTLKFFHRNQIAVCNFFASCISVDEDYNIKLFEFDSVLNLENPNRPVAEGFLRGHFKFEPPESWMEEHFEREWFYALDAFAFEVLLMELTWERCVDEDGVYHFIEQTKEDLAKVTLSNPKKIIFDLAMKCVEKDPKGQPNMDEVVRELEKVSQL